jgi:hypothetical protein
LGGRADFLCPFIWSRVSNLMQFLTADQKQQHVNFCKDLYQITSGGGTFLSRVITGDPEAKQQSSQWKSPNSRRPKKGIVHKVFIVAGQTVNSTYYCDVLWRLLENM